jgi:hypothetical protein
MKMKLGNIAYFATLTHCLPAWFMPFSSARDFTSFAME